MLSLTIRLGHVIPNHRLLREVTALVIIIKLKGWEPVCSELTRLIVILGICKFRTNWLSTHFDLMIYYYEHCYLRYRRSLYHKLCRVGSGRWYLVESVGALRGIKIFGLWEEDGRNFYICAFGASVSDPFFVNALFVGALTSLGMLSLSCHQIITYGFFWTRYLGKMRDGFDA